MGRGKKGQVVPAGGKGGGGQCTRTVSALHEQAPNQGVPELPGEAVRDREGIHNADAPGRHAHCLEVLAREHISHSERSKMYLGIVEKYYWPRLEKDMKRVVADLLKVDFLAQSKHDF